MEVEVDLTGLTDRIRDLRRDVQVRAFIRLDAEEEHVRLRCLERSEHAMRWLLELDCDRRRFGSERLTGPEVEGHPLPSPIIDEETSGGEGRRARSLGRSVGLRVSRVLAGDERALADWARRSDSASL